MTNNETVATGNATKTTCRECGETISSKNAKMVACPKCELIQYAGVTPVRLSDEPSGDCVTGCGEPAFAYGCAELDGYVDACRGCAVMVLTDAVKYQKGDA